MPDTIPQNCTWVGGVSPTDLSEMNGGEGAAYRAKPVTAQATAPRRRPNFERNRAAILSACRAAMRSGTFRPSAIDVAREAKVSIRTVFGHFANHEGMLVAAIEDEETRRTILALLLRDSLFPAEADCLRVIRAAVLGRA